MTSKGSVYGQLSRAIAAGHTQRAMFLALEVERVQLPEALGLCLLLATDQDERYPAAARRWLARFAEERKPELDVLADVAEALAELGREPESTLAREVLGEALV